MEALKVQNETTGCCGGNCCGGEGKTDGSGCGGACGKEVCDCKKEAA